MSTATLNAPATTDEAAILFLISSIIQAHYDKSAEGISAPYAPHAIIYDLEPPLMHDGISVERKRKWLTTWDSPIGIEPRDFELTINGDHAYAHGYLRMSRAEEGCRPPRRASGCAKPYASSASTARGASSTNTRLCRSIWTKPFGRRSICSRKEQRAPSCAACAL